MRRVLFLLTLPLIGACDSIPRDLAGTLERIRQDGIVRVGVIASPRPSPYDRRVQALVERSGQAAGARPLLRRDAAEPLLLMLEAGEIDLVVGEFDRGSPWVNRVHLLPPLARERRSGSELETTGAVRNGENGWIMLLERQARSLGASG